MKLSRAELEYLSACAREEWEADCYQRPAHRLQLSHGVVGAHLIDLIKAWAESEGKLDQAIVQAAANSEPCWPWSSKEDFLDRLSQAQRLVARGATAAAPGSTSSRP
jgi:hypothetical protein